MLCVRKKKIWQTKNCIDREFHLVRLNSARFMVFSPHYGYFGFWVLINPQKGELNMQYLKKSKYFSIRERSKSRRLRWRLCRDEGLLIKTATCVQLSAAFVWKYNLKTYTIQSTEWYWFEARYFLKMKKINLLCKTSSALCLCALSNIGFVFPQDLNLSDPCNLSLVVLSLGCRSNP